MKFSNTKALTSRLLVALVMVAAGVAGLSSIAEAATCYTCHAPVNSTTDIRPVESTYRNVTTGSIKGSHAKHMASPIVAANASQCNVCHGTTVSVTKHRDGFIHLTSTGYISGRTFPQSGAPVMQTCTTASCHDNGVGQGVASLVETPPWGTAAVSCTICHLSRPATGSHPEHFSDANNALTITCASCHNGYVEGSTVNATNHLNGKIDVYKTAALDLGYPATRTKGAVYTNCTLASCHRNPSVTVAGPAFSQLVTPAWGLFPSPAKCTSCHASRPTTGSHPAHYNAGFPLCTNCHAGAVEGVNAPTTGHLDGNIDVTGYNVQSKAPSFPASASYTFCSTASCHTNGRGGQVPSPQWGQTNNDCSACHAKQPATGTHTGHITVGITCGECHLGAVDGLTAPLKHLNGKIDVYKTTPGDLGIIADKGINTPYTTCNTSVCHRDGSPNWGTGTTANVQCTKCHGKPTVSNYSSATNAQAAPGYGGTLTSFGHTGTLTGNVNSSLRIGSHDTHLRGLNNIGKPVLCTDCHVVPATVFGLGHRDGDSAPTVASFSNFTKNHETVPSSSIPYTFAKGDLVPVYNTVDGTCSSTYCHGATLPGGNDKAPKWNVTTYITGNRAVDCAQCHGYPPTAGSSLYNHNATTDMTCSSCHPHNGYRTSTDTGPGALGNDTHMNGKIEANKHCDSCHDYDTRGGGTVWGKNAIATEGYGAHAAHITYLKKRMNVTTMDSNLDVFGTTNFNGICGVCHTRNLSNHMQSDRTNVSPEAKRNITFGSLTSMALRKFGASNPVYNGVTNVGSATTLKTCSNVDCHYKTSPIWQSF